MRLDAHVHLSLFPAREQLLIALLSSKLMPLAVSCSLEDAQVNLELALKIPFNFLVGIHPWYAKSSYFDERAFVDILNKPSCLGIGECGLDSKCADDIQIPLLERQLDLALKYQVPVSLHVYKKHGELIALLRKYQGKISGMIHGFYSSQAIAKSYLDLGLYLSFGRTLIQERSKIPALLNFIPQDRILVESDADFKNNRPYDMALAAKQYALLANHLKLDMKACEDLLYNNFCTLFLRKKL